MRFIILFIVFLSLNTVVLANVSTVAKPEIDSITYPQKHAIPWDTVVGKFRKLAEVSRECFVLMKNGMRAEGVIGYTRKHQDVFLPIIVFLILYMFWLRKRARQ